MIRFARSAVAYTFAMMVVAGVLALVLLDFLRTPLASTGEHEPDGLQSTQEAVQELLADIKLKEPVKEANAEPVVYDYSIFKKIPFGTDGFDVVTVGMEFANSNTTTPRDQWCYITKSAGVEATALKITLAVKADGERIDVPITADMANEGGTSVEVIEVAQKACRFL